MSEIKESCQRCTELEQALNEMADLPIGDALSVSTPLRAFREAQEILERVGLKPPPGPATLFVRDHMDKMAKERCEDE